MERLATMAAWTAAGHTLVEAAGAWGGGFADSEAGACLLTTGGLILAARGAADPANRPFLLGLGVGIGVQAMFGVAVVPRIPSLLLTATAVGVAGVQRRRLTEGSNVKVAIIEVLFGAGVHFFGFVLRMFRESPTLSNVVVGAGVQTLGIVAAGVGVVSLYPGTGVIELATLAAVRTVLATANVE